MSAVLSLSLTIYPTLSVALKCLAATTTGYASCTAQNFGKQGVVMRPGLLLQHFPRAIQIFSHHTRKSILQLAHSLLFTDSDLLLHKLKDEGV